MENMNVWDKLTRLVVILTLVAAVLAVVKWYYPVIKENESWRKQKLSFEQQIKQEELLARKLEVSVRSMDDPRTVERLARETWCYAKPGETVIHFDPPAPPSNAPALAPK